MRDLWKAELEMRFVAQFLVAGYRYYAVLYSYYDTLQVGTYCDRYAEASIRICGETIAEFCASLYMY